MGSEMCIRDSPQPGDDEGSAVCEGPLLTALLNKIETLLDQVWVVWVCTCKRGLLYINSCLPLQPYEVNLLLTSILASLVAVPHPMVDWLCATTPPKGYPRNLYSALEKVSAELQSHAERTPGMAVNIIEARRRLAGQETSDLLSMPHNDLLEGAIVLEEFSKVCIYH